MQETSISRAKLMVGAGPRGLTGDRLKGGYSRPPPSRAAIPRDPTPGDMNISVSQGEKVDSDGTQGSFTNAVEGTQDSDGDQDAFDTQSWGGRPSGQAAHQIGEPAGVSDAHRRHRRRNRHHWCPRLGFIAAVESRLGDLLLGQRSVLPGMTVGAQLRLARWGRRSPDNRPARCASDRSGRRGVDTCLTEHGQTGCRQCRRAETTNRFAIRKPPLHRSLALGMPA